jgi:hypothetical protein
VCTADNCGNKHPKVCNIPAHSKGKVRRSTCKLWHMRVPFAGRTQGNFTGRRNGPAPPTGSKGNKSKLVRPVKPDWIVKLEQEQGRMMTQGVSYLLVAEQSSARTHAPPPVHVPHAPHDHAPQQACPAIATADVIAKIKIILNQLRNQ